jgi:hypothetical protein
MKNKSTYFSQVFMIAFIVSAVVIFSTLLLSSFVGFNAPADIAAQIASDEENQAATTTWYYIFINNFGLTLFTFMPFFGFAFEMFTQFDTGYSFGALAQVYQVNNVQAVLITLATPVGFFEYASYIFASAESLVVAYSIYKREFMNRLVNHTWKTLIFVALFLLIGAIVEAALIGRL